jgi:hypothetical protein
VSEQRYKGVLAVIGDGRTVTELARELSVSRKTLHASRGMSLRVWRDSMTTRLAHCPHQISPSVVAKVVEMRRAKTTNRVTLLLGPQYLSDGRVTGSSS